jgi:hypothetical protein
MAEAAQQLTALAHAAALAQRIAQDAGATARRKGSVSCFVIVAR